MRLLTLGVIVVSGGILAALPFRVRQAQREAADPVARATGPTLRQAESFGGVRILTQSDQQPLAERVAFDRPPAVPDLLSPVHDVGMPLTYRDLAIPVQTPEAIRQRYPATSDPIGPPQRPDAAPPDRRGSEATRFEPIVEDPRETLRPQSEPPQVDPQPTGQLASSMLPPPPPEAAAPPPRQRHWIVQP